MEFKTAQELIDAWDAGETIWSIEMGGLGPGYEQALQVAAIEMTRKAIYFKQCGDKEKDTEVFTMLCDEALKLIDDKLGGLSGAQYGAARYLAWNWITKGPETLYKIYRDAEKEGKENRMIQVSNMWPHITKEGK